MKGGRINRALISAILFFGLYFIYSFSTAPACASGCTSVSFTSTTVMSAYGANTVRSADMDGDGDMDIISGSSADAGLLYIALNNGSGAFPSQITVTSTDQSTYEIEVADFNADGRMDIVASDRYGEAVYWYKNNGSYSFTQNTVASGLAADSVYDVATGDIDGDGDIDILAAVAGTADDILWYSNNGNNTFASAAFVDSNLPGAYSIATGDLDGDGDTDVAAVSAELGGGLSYYLNNGSGSFSETSLTTSPRSEVYIADIDSDGDNDLLAAAQNALYLYRVTAGTVSSSATTLYSGSAIFSELMIADINGDGEKDLVTSDSSSGAAGNISWWKNDGSETFTRNNVVSTTYAYQVYAADITGDSKIDLATAEQNSINKVSLLTQICNDANPTLATVFPADNATTTTSTPNLIMVFSEAVTVGSGNVTIFNADDNSIFESITITSSTQVSGSGTATITINPNSVFSSQTNYYVLVSSTAFADVDNNSYAGISSTSTWNFTTADLVAPAISVVVATASETAATITWNTDESASSRVWYGPTTTYALATSETDTSPGVTAHSITLTSLPSCATYYYAVVSRDTMLNSATSSDYYFTTSGCTGSSAITSEAATAASTSTITTLSILNSTTGLSLDIPSGYASTTATFQAKKLVQDTVISAVGAPSGYVKAGDYSYSLKAITNALATISVFDQPLTLTMAYTAGDILNLIETSLKIYRWDDAVWQVLDSCTVDTTARSVRCTTSHFSTFSLFGQAANSSAGINFTVGPGVASSPIPKIDKSESEKIITPDSPLSPPPITPPQQNLATSSLPTPPQTESCWFTLKRPLSRGDFGEEVKVLQQTLNKTNPLAQSGPGSALQETKFFGTLTKQALVQFQKQHNLAPSGTVDEASAKALGWCFSSHVNIFNRNLSLGKRGVDVLRLQKFLKQLQLFTSELSPSEYKTGYFGETTLLAVKKFQERYGITPAKGYVGLITRKKLATFYQNEADYALDK